MRLVDSNLVHFLFVLEFDSDNLIEHFTINIKFSYGKRDHVQMLKLRHPGPSHFLSQGAIIEGQPAIFPILISKCLYKQEDSYKGSSQSSIVL